MLRKSVKWEWTEEQNEAFVRVKKFRSNRPLLIYPDFPKPFVLETDASLVGLANKVYGPNYSTMELECLAVVWSVKLFSPYVYGRAFIIVWRLNG